MHIDWAYLRQGGTSCKKAPEFLSANPITLGKVVDARQKRIDVATAEKLIGSAKRIHVRRGVTATAFSFIHS